MPRTRSQDKISIMNKDAESDHEEPLEITVQVNNKKCQVCDKEYEKWFNKEIISIQHHCLCILNLCQACSEKCEQEEYCPLDKHDTLQAYVNSLYRQYQRDIVSKDIQCRIVCDLDGVRIHCYQDSDSILECANQDNTDGVNTGPNFIFVTINYNIDRSNVEINNMKVGYPPSTPSTSSYSDCQSQSRTKKNDWNWLWFVIIPGFALAFSYYGYSYFANSSEAPSIPFESVIQKKVFDKINEMEKEYTKQPKDLWITLKLGMRKLLKQSNEPTTILLLHGESYSVDTCILSDIKNIIIKDIVPYQLNKANSNDLVIKDENQLKGVRLDMDLYKEVFTDPGQFMTKYKADLERDKILILKNFHNSPTTVMEAFHYLSDVYDPWVKNLLVILTMKIRDSTVSNIKNSTALNGRPERLAEDELNFLLKDLPDHIRRPLITRLTDNSYLFVDEGEHFLRISCTL